MNGYEIGFDESWQVYEICVQLHGRNGPYAPVKPVVHLPMREIAGLLAKPKRRNSAISNTPAEIEQGQYRTAIYGVCWTMHREEIVHRAQFQTTPPRLSRASR